MSSRTGTYHVRLYEGRYVWLFVIVALAFSVLLGRLWYLQVLQGDTFHRMATENIIRNVDIKPPRGKILDRNGVILADNRPSFDVYLSPHIFARSGSEESLALLQEYLNLSDKELDEIRGKLKSRAAEIVVKRDISRQQVARIEGDRMRLAGFEIRANSHRYYPLHQLAAHTLGFMGEVRSDELQDLGPLGYRSGDFLGRMGVERAFESILRGSPGIERRVVDARGIPQGEAETKFLIGDYQRVEAIPGRDVQLTIDAELYLIIDHAMRRVATGAVVAIDPSDGSVLAAYSKPSFNPNSWSGRLSAQEKLRSDNDPFRPMLDKSVNAYFPGSVFKIAPALAALEEGIMKPQDTVTCRGGYVFGGRRFRCWREAGHGKVNLVDALKVSCDVYFYKLAETIGIDTIAEYGRRFGFGEATGFPVNSESAGRMPTRAWHQEHTPGGFQHGFALNTVLGQGDTLSSPMQVAYAYAAIANGGAIYNPRLVEEIRNHRGDTLFTFPARVRKRLLADAAHLAPLIEGLVATVEDEEGTAHLIHESLVSMAGKTGTAQVARIGRVRVANRDREFRLRDHAWFASWAPAENPEIVLVVLLEHGGHGGSDAAPIAREILEGYLTREQGEILRRKIEFEAPDTKFSVEDISDFLDEEP